MKKISAILMIFCCMCTILIQRAKAIEPEIRATWLSYYELAPSGKNWTEETFRNHFQKLFQKISNYGIQVIFVHVRPFSDAIYPTKLAPFSDVFTGKQGKNPGFDPLVILCELGVTQGLQLHAWLNPFRVSRDKDLEKLAKNNSAKVHIQKKDHWVELANGQYYWNPAQLETHAIVYRAVRELLRRYPTVAGIHIDDYFYPTTKESFDKTQYEKYQKKGGTLSRAEWRKELVSAFVRGLYRETKKIRPSAVVSISPASEIDKNCNSLYADVRRWVREPGYADWMLPQIYFGFEHATQPFRTTARQWSELERHQNLRLMFGLAAYKTGTEDRWAGANGRCEWVEHTDILAREVEFLRTLPSYYGFSLYSSKVLFAEKISKSAKLERENLQKLLF